MTSFCLRPSDEELREALDAYDPADDDEVERIGQEVQQRRCLTNDDLLGLVRWKSPRTMWLAEKNEDSFTCEVTRAALGTSNERLRIEALTLLDGVAWPVASVVLHFCVPNQYPILDVRALWTLGFDERPTYHFKFWSCYVHFCRDLRSTLNLTMRELDRGLWMYSKKVGRSAAHS